MGGCQWRDRPCITRKNMNNKRCKNKYGYFLMLLSGTYPHGGLRTISIHSYAQLNRGSTQITTATRDIVSTATTKIRLVQAEGSATVSNAPTPSQGRPSDQRPHPSSPEAHRTREADRARKTPSHQETTTSERIARITEWQCGCWSSVSRISAEIEPWTDRPVVSGESSLGFEARSALTLIAEIN